MTAMTSRGWLVLAAVCTMGMIATFNLAQHPTPSLSAFHLDELRQQQPHLDRIQGAASLHEPPSALDWMWHALGLTSNLKHWPK